MLLLKFDENIRTRTTYKSKIQFGNVLPGKELHSFSIFGENEIRTVIFKEKEFEYWSFDEQGNLSKYQKYGLSHNVPIIDAEIKIREEDETHIEFDSKDNRGSSGNLSIGTLKTDSINKWTLSFSRVETFLGYNIKFEFITEGGTIVQTKKYAWNYDEKAMELKNSFSHEYQFRELRLERLVENIFSNGWDEKYVSKEIQYIELSLWMK
jgi:hypothetical protein